MTLLLLKDLVVDIMSRSGSDTMLLPLTLCLVGILEPFVFFLFFPDLPDL